MHPIRSPQTKSGLQQQKKQHKLKNIWKLNNALLNDNLVKEEIKKEIKDFLEFSENEGTSHSKTYRTQ